MELPESLLHWQHQAWPLGAQARWGSSLHRVLQVSRSSGEVQEQAFLEAALSRDGHTDRGHSNPSSRSSAGGLGRAPREAPSHWDGLRRKLVSEVRAVPVRPLQGLGEPGHQNHRKVQKSSHLPSAPQHTHVLRKIPQRLQAKSRSDIRQQRKQTPQPNFSSELGGHLLGLHGKPWARVEANASDGQ